jgi:plastocyanin
MKTTGVLLLVVAILVIAGGIFLIMNNNNSGTIGQAVNTQPVQNPTTSVPAPTTNTPASTETQAPQTSVPTPTTTSPSTGNINSISISRFMFSPQTLTIKVGDGVMWTNLDGTPHSVRSDSGSELNSATLGQGDRYYHVFATAGTYDYHDSIDLYMNGTIIVQ